VSESSGDKSYPHEFEPNTSHANAVALLDKAEVPLGVVLDIGCGNAPAAEPLAERGFDYVALDVDKASLDGLKARGFETHKVDLGVASARLLKKLNEIVGDRTITAIFALDVLEHVVEPRSVVETLAALAAPHEGCSLLVSIPNVTHRDITARMMLGHWDMTPVGLLDDTHVRFFSPDGLERLFAGSGWTQVDALDTTAEYTEQFSMLRSPALQPAAPIGDLLRRIRGMSAPHATTYQYVRRLVLADDVPSTVSDEPAAPFLSVIVVGVADDARPTVLDDLDAQTDDDLDVITLGEAWDHDDLNAAARAARGHYLGFLDASDRVGPSYVASVRKGANPVNDLIAADCVVRLDATVYDDAAVDGTVLDGGAASDAVSFDELTAGRVPIEPDGFDLLRSDLLGRTALAAYAVPSSAIQTLGLAFDPALGPAAPATFLARAVELCSLRGVRDLQVVVAEHRVRDADDDLDGVRDGLGGGAYLLPPGGVARLVVQRRTLTRSLERLESLQAEVEDLRPRVHFAEGERERLDTEITAMLNTKLWRYGQRARTLYARGRRLIASRLRR
jgi:2-polyprenyl-3-methyl-5-hydroxy-6-metoxy-1,4-benzoquinol methylase